MDVSGERFTAKHILIATGARPIIPDIPGKEHAISSDEALDLETFPKRIVILGAGYIGMEFAGIFNAFGAEVHLVCRMVRSSAPFVSPAHRPQQRGGDAGAWHCSFRPGIERYIKAPFPGVGAQDRPLRGFDEEVRTFLVCAGRVAAAEA